MVPPLWLRASASHRFCFRCYLPLPPQVQSAAVSTGADILAVTASATSGSTTNVIRAVCSTAGASTWNLLTLSNSGGTAFRVRHHLRSEKACTTRNVVLSLRLHYGCPSFLVPPHRCKVMAQCTARSTQGSCTYLPSAPVAQAHSLPPTAAQFTSCRALVLPRYPRRPPRDARAFPPLLERFLRCA